MYGLFGALETGKRSLMAQQMAMTTAGHNIANLNTPGYSRQRVNLHSSFPLHTTQGAIGTGVDVASIRHIRDDFLTNRFRRENGSYQRWQTTHTALSQVEGFFSEPGENGLSQILNEFWNSWENLSTHPEARTAVIEKSKVLVNAFHEHAHQLGDLRQSIDRDINLKIGQINEIARQIAAANGDIVAAEGVSGRANDLRDRRDYLIDQLSNLAGVRTIDQENGSVRVLIGSMALVDGIDALNIDTKMEEYDGERVTVAHWQNTKFSIDFSGGELFALYQVRDELITDARSQLDDIAAALVTQVNAVHAGGIGADGSTGINFFDPFHTTAETISLAEEVLSDPNYIASSVSGEPGDTRNAQAISELRYARVLASGTLAINEYYANFIGTLGIQTKEAENLKDNYSLLVNQVEGARQSVQGVSEDEEMVQMIRFQRAYEAAARIITYVDSALETVINGMGMIR